MSRSLNHIMASAEQTDSFALIKTKSVTSNINQPKTSETNKIIEVIMSAPYTANTHVLSSGTAQLQTANRDENVNRCTFI